jgi:hypothetical protein
LIWPINNCSALCHPFLVQKILLHEALFAGHMPQVGTVALPYFLRFLQHNEVANRKTPRFVIAELQHLPIVPRSAPHPDGHILLVEGGVLVGGVMAGGGVLAAGLLGVWFEG